MGRSIWLALWTKMENWVDWKYVLCRSHIYHFARPLARRSMWQKMDCYHLLYFAHPSNNWLDAGTRPHYLIHPNVPHWFNFWRQDYRRFELASWVLVIQKKRDGSLCKNDDCFWLDNYNYCYLLIWNQALANCHCYILKSLYNRYHLCCNLCSWVIWIPSW